MANINDLGKRMRLWREFREHSLQVVGDTCGMSRQAISLIESGENSISVAKLHLICTKAFGIDLCTFFGPLPSERARRAA